MYGYPDLIESSRRLKRECQSNVELMWLNTRLARVLKTIADSRKDHGDAIGNVCRRFVVMCRDLELLAQAAVAIDGRNFKAVNNPERNNTPGKNERREREFEASIQPYLNALETADRTQPVEAPAKTAQLQGKIEKIRERMQSPQDSQVNLRANLFARYRKLTQMHGR